MHTNIHPPSVVCYSFRTRVWYTSILAHLVSKMSISSSVVLGHRPPRSSSTIYIGPPRGDTERSAPLVSPRTQGDKKDLVTFLEALSTVLVQNPWLRLEVMNALDGTNLSAGQTFSVRRHILGRRLHAYKRLVPGDTVILKVARGYKAGRATIPDGSADHEVSEQMDALIREVQVLTHRRVRDAPETIDLLHLLWEHDQGILRPVLVFEYANGGTLAAFARSSRAENLETKESLCRDVVKGLAVLHEVGVIHGDVKCENVVVFQQDDGSFRAKLIDFGFSIFLAELESGAHIKIGGTEPFTPPEATSLLAREALIYTDYFCFGILVWQVLLDGLHDEDLFYQEPFHCPLRAASKSNWSTYIQNAKKEVTFINKVKASVRPTFSESDEAYWAYFSCIFENTLSSVPTQRRIDRILAFTGDP
jgi:serine/threonine protein kinase